MPRAAPTSREEPPSEDAPRKTVRRPPKRMTEKRLANIAAYYLQRYSSTAPQLRQVLTRRCDRSQKAEGAAPRAEMIEWVNALVARLVAAGAVNDAAYAAGKAARMRGLGKGSGRIRAALRAKGITADEAERVVAETATRADGSSADLAAALGYIRRRRLGPFRKTPRDRDTDRRDLGALVRAGFGLDVAREALKISDTEAEDWNE